MANHVRQQLRDAIVTAVTGLATTGANVFKSSVYAKQESQVPALAVHVTGDELSAGMDSPLVIERLVRVSVFGYARSTTDVESFLHTIGKEVETALQSVVVGGKTVYLAYQGSDLQIDALDQPVGQIEMRYETLIYNLANAPDVIQ